MEKMKKTALYIHIPFCLKKCAYCDFASYEDLSLQEAYFGALKKEIEIVAGEWEGRTFDTLFLGGGTPTCAEDIFIESVTEKAKRILKFDLKEATVEANPGTVGLEKLEFYRYMGINRISFGVQAAQDRLLKAVGRIHDFGTAAESVELAHHAGFRNINIDIMSGLPGQEAEDLLESVAQAEKLRATHISMYTLKLEENTPLYTAVNGGKITLPDKDEEYDMSKAARDRLSKLGYVRYEISNYAKPGFECLHNLHYWNNDDYLGVGLSASSGLNGRRTTNTRDIAEYIEKLNSGILPYAENAQSGSEEYAFETLMLGLRLVRGIDIDEYKARHGIDLRERFKETLASLRDRGLADIYEGRLYLTEHGMDIQNTVLVEFMEKFEV